jgi:nucleotide-binding universal stress UspA family protein
MLSTRAEIYLKRIAQDLESEGVQARVEQLVGNPAEEIVRYAAEYHPRLIVMSTHGYSGFSHFVFSSVTENVLRRLQKTPLFLIRPDGNDPALLSFREGGNLD